MLVLALIILCLGMLIGFLFARLLFAAAGVLFFFSMVVAYFALRPLYRLMDDWSRQKIRFMRGAQAEALVAWYLKDLSNKWHVFHNLPCALGGDVDHIVVGPAGIFVISTKSYKGHVVRAANGTVKLNGETLSDLDQAMKLAMWVKDRLKGVLGKQLPWVQPVLALPFALVEIPPTDCPVWIVDDTMLLDTLNPENPKCRLSDQRIEQIAVELVRSSHLSKQRA
jgi:hypothetical protein